MSVYGALYSGVSGLAAYSNALGMISDNITNVNTVGYKATAARFSTMVTEGSSRTTYSPGGVQASPQTLVNKQGLLQSSSSETDLGIIGAGFFVVSDSSGDGLESSGIKFTRAGSFYPDDEGFLRNTAGLYLKGWPIDENGNIPTNLGDLSTLQTINTSGLTGTAEATTRVSLRANLQSSQTVNPAEATYTAGDLATGAIPADFERNVQIYDAQGGTHTVTLAMLKSSTTNEWHVEMYMRPPSDVDGVAHPNGLIGSGTMAFNPDGSLDQTNTTAGLMQPIAIDWTNGAADSTVTFNWGSNGRTDGFTQFDSVSTLISSSVNGAVFGNVTGVEITDQGVVIAQFDNGLVKPVYRLPIATFQNPDGLERSSGNSFTQSDYSGIFSLQMAGSGGAGKVAPSTLEASTVDLAHEFTNLITTQRAYSASTKVITTADEMLDELNRLKR